jgi:hydrogenase assembly chaperone HypC/HupF
MCISLPSYVTQIKGSMALTVCNGRQTWCNALAQPEVQVGDYVLTHANLIIAIISEAEAQETISAAQELDALLDAADEGGTHS